MEVNYTEKALTDREFWKKSGKVKIMAKISSLIEEIKITPFSGTGKPEALKHDLSGKWSRRIDREHRLIYEMDDGKIVVHSMKGHY